MKILYFFISHPAEGFQSFNIHIMEFMDSANKIPGIEVIPGFPLKKSQRDLEPELKLFHQIKYFIPRFLKDLLGLGYNLVYGYRALKRIKTERPDLILFRNNFNNIYPFLVNAFLSKPLPVVLEVNTPHSYERAQFGQLYFEKLCWLLEKWVWKKASGIFTVSEAQKKLLTSWGVPANKIISIHNGVNLDLFKKQEKKADDLIRILFVGSFRVYHGLHWIIPLACNLKNKTRKRFKFIIIGKGEELPAFKQNVKKHNGSDLFEIKGFVPYEEVPNAITEAHIGFMGDFTSYGSPIKLFEYMAGGLALLMPRKAPILEILKENEDALFFDVGDALEFQDQLMVLINDRGKRSEMGRRVRAKVEKDYTWDRNAESVISFSKEFLN